jgi:predicted SAM-dependent methyltransferase
LGGARDGKQRIPQAPTINPVCANGLPFNDSTVEAIYSEHCFEHLDYESEAKHFLRECLRCLKPQGVLRIVVPDAGDTFAFMRKEIGTDWQQSVR